MVGNVRNDPAAHVAPAGLSRRLHPPPLPEVNNVDANVRCTGASLDMVFPRAGSPRELIAAFAAVRGSFAVNRVLAGLIQP